MMSRMRRLAVVSLLALVVALPTSAATVDPRSLVLGQRELPAGFRVDPSDAGVLTNAAEGRRHPGWLTRFRRWERLTGYQAAYERADSGKVEVRADLFRATAGARSMFGLMMREVEGSTYTIQTRAPVTIGQEGVIYGSSADFNLVLWRRGRVFSYLQGIDLPRSRTLDLARAQDRKIAAALR
jgi:hypothetical protein